MNLNDQELTARLQRLVKTERKITHLILECIAEIDRRRIYLDRAYPSLFEYLVNEFGYSPAAAMRRIDGARLIQQLPEVSEKIQEGSINLTQISQLQQAVRAVQKNESRKVDVAEKREVIAQLEGATYKATEIIIAQAWNAPVKTNDSERVHADGSVTLTIHLSKEQFQLLKGSQEQVAHSVPSGKWVDVIEYLAKQKIVKLQKAVKEDISSQREDDQFRKMLEESRVYKTVPIYLRNLKLQKSKYECEYFDHETQQKCTSKRFLQIDHILPKWAGGENVSENLQVLCGPHNRHKFGYSKNVT